MGFHSIILKEKRFSHRCVMNFERQTTSFLFIIILIVPLSGTFLNVLLYVVFFHYYSCTTVRIKLLITEPVTTLNLMEITNFSILNLKSSVLPLSLAGIKCLLQNCSCNFFYSRPVSVHHLS